MLENPAQRHTRAVAQIRASCLHRQHLWTGIFEHAKRAYDAQKFCLCANTDMSPQTTIKQQLAYFIKRVYKSVYMLGDKLLKKVVLCP